MAFINNMEYIAAAIYINLFDERASISLKYCTVKMDEQERLRIIKIYNFNFQYLSFVFRNYSNNLFVTVKKVGGILRAHRKFQKVRVADARNCLRLYGLSQQLRARQSMGDCYVTSPRRWTFAEK